MNGELWSETLLEGFRALDLTDEGGLLCGKILADLGADVIKVEKPGGDRVRNIGPFYHDIPSPEKSLFWFSFNLNKKGITLDIENPDGQEIFKRLVETADFVLESFSPGYMDNLGLGYKELSEINPRIIMISVTPFGQTGPYRDYKGSDLTSMALGGYLYVNGDPDRPPALFSFPQAIFHAGAEAAAASLIALYFREMTGEGQYIDVSTLQCIAGILIDVNQSWFMNQRNVTRQGVQRIRPTGAKLRMIWPCQDGYISFFLFGGVAGVKSMQALVDWIDSEGMGDPCIRIDWKQYNWSTVKPEEIDPIQEVILRFFSTHTKMELYEGALERGVQLFPAYNSKEIWEDLQLAERDFWEEVEHPELGVSISYPGAFIRLSENPLSIRCRAPLIGEHNEDVYEKEMGISKQELILLKQAGVI